MTKTLGSIALIALLTAPSSGQAGFEDLPKLTRAQQVEDLAAWRRGFEEGHPGMHRWSSPEELGHAYERVLASLEAETDVLSFWRTLSPLNARVRCGHAPLNLPRSVTARVLGPSARVPPLSIRLVGDRAVVHRVLVDDSSIQPGDELLAIDGLPFPRIRDRIFDGLHADGFNTSVKRFELERKFGTLFPLFVDARSTEFRLRALGRAGAELEVVLPGVGLDEWNAKTRSAPEPPMSFSILQDHGVGRLTISTLSDGALERSGPGLAETLEQAIREMAGKAVHKLILDLRGNSGGSDFHVVLLLTFLMQEPFQVFERIEVKQDWVAPEGHGGRGTTELDEHGRRVIARHPGLEVVEPEEESFDGELVVLIDGGTFSSAADVAAVLHRTGRATLVGEETGGGYSGNTSGPGQLLTLPNSGVLVPVRSWSYYTKDVSASVYRGGVPPHAPVLPTAEDVISGRDVALLRALEILANGE